MHNVLSITGAMPAKIMECRSPSLVIDSAQHKAQHRAQHACQIACNVADMTFLAEACWQIFVESHRQRMRRLPNSWIEQAAVQVSNQIDCSEQARVVLSHPPGLWAETGSCLAKACNAQQQSVRLYCKMHPKKHTIARCQSC